MAALVFPVAPALNQKFPANPGDSGVTQWQWDGSKWNVVSPSVSLGVENQQAFNAYKWPLTDGTSGEQLTTDGVGNLRWEVPASTELVLLDNISSQFNNLETSFFLELGGAPFTPTPSTNILVFLGGAPQIPGAGNAYTVVGDVIIFASAPPLGTTFYAISSVIS
jgi:hypothetical protein